jgi:hypothetical protein
MLHSGDQKQRLGRMVDQKVEFFLMKPYITSVRGKLFQKCDLFSFKSEYAPLKFPASV